MRTRLHDPDDLVDKHGQSILYTDAELSDCVGSAQGL